MKKLIPALVMTCIFVSVAGAQVYLAPDGGTALNGTVNFVFPPQTPFRTGGPMAAGYALPCPAGYPASGPTLISPAYWASYPMVMIPMVPPSGPIDAWAEPKHRSQ